MFGLFKRKIAFDDFGQVVLHAAKEFVMSDASRSLVTQFKDFDYGGPEAAPIFLERHGLSPSLQKLYLRIYTHCAMQACFSRYGDASREMTRGAMSLFSNDIEGYNFSNTYSALDAAYRGQHRFSSMVEPLGNIEAKLTSLPNASAGVVNAKYLIENFVLPNMSNRSAFIDGFELYSGTVFSTLGTVCRAADHTLKSVKI